MVSIPRYPRSLSLEEISSPDRSSMIFPISGPIATRSLSQLSPSYSWWGYPTASFTRLAEDPRNLPNRLLRPLEGLFHSRRDSSPQRRVQRDLFCFLKGNQSEIAPPKKKFGCVETVLQQYGEPRGVRVGEFQSYVPLEIPTHSH
ncbi:hypothetical protein TNCV_3783491 [Trichonephila clavipes]|nr:hypothetical protein TNCV_3783491 [Trichonephila clavipes]